MDRRIFLKLLGMTPVGLVIDPGAVFANPVDALGHVTPIGPLVTSFARVSALNVTAHVAGDYTLMRTQLGRPPSPLLQVALWPETTLRWEPHLGSEIILPPGHGLELVGPKGVTSWSAPWFDDKDVGHIVGARDGVRFSMPLDLVDPVLER